ncbi:MAG: hypothetical protein ABSE25_12870 [Syntrophorhabdales bacterium]|jgi:dolichol kinase
MRRISWARKLFHLSGCLIPLIYMVHGKTAALLVTGTALAMAALIETLRLKGRIRPAFVEPLLKEKEARGPAGTLFYLVSCLTTIILFDKAVSSASILVLAIADPLSAAVGSRWGRISFLGKSGEGTAAFFFSSLLILACFSFNAGSIIAASAAACAAELLSTKLVDDNLTIPLVAALCLTALR